jgi:hypothetical protein
MNTSSGRTVRLGSYDPVFLKAAGGIKLIHAEAELSEEIHIYFTITVRLLCEIIG